MERVNDYHKTSIDNSLTGKYYKRRLHRAPKTTKQIFSCVQMQKTQPASYIAILTFNARFMSVLFKAEQFT